MIPFNSAQFRPDPGITLIEASAGTGKTYSITEIVARLIGQGEATIDQILVLTFTNAATEELNQRIRKKLENAQDEALHAEDIQGYQNLSIALEDFDRANISTIHGFCQRTLKAYSQECGISSEFTLIPDSREFHESLKQGIYRGMQQQANRSPWIVPTSLYLGLEGPFLDKLLDKTDDPKIDAYPVAQLDEAITQFFNELQQTWISEQATIQEACLDAQTTLLKKDAWRSLKQASVTLEALFNKGIWEPQLFNDLLRFHPDHLEAQLKSKKIMPTLNVFTQVTVFTQLLNKCCHWLVDWIATQNRKNTQRLVFEQDTLRYDDLLNHLNHCLIANPSLAQRLAQDFTIGIIDEFQDTDPVQLSILQNIFLTNDSPKSLIFIGDPKQAIYSFRGGDIFTYFAAQKEAVAAYSLTTNWRSNKTINDGVNALLNLEDPFLYPWIGYESIQTSPNSSQKRAYYQNEEVSGIHWMPFEADLNATHKTLTDALINDIQDLLSDNYYLENATEGRRPLNIEDIAILVPSNDTASKLKSTLEKFALSAVILGGASVYESDEAQVWHTILQALIKPDSTAFLFGALSTPPFNYSASHIHALSEDVQSLSSLVQHFLKAHELWINRGLPHALKYMELAFHWVENLAQSANPDRALANFYHLYDLILSLTESTREPRDLLRVYQKKMQMPDQSNMDELLRLDKQTHALRIITMHKSKGLQFPVVLIPFPDSVDTQRAMELPMDYHDSYHAKQRAYTQFDLTEESREAKSIAHISEKMRLSYVAITRAEYICKVYLNAKPTSWKKATVCQWLRKHVNAAEDLDLESALRYLQTKYPGLFRISEPNLEKLQKSTRGDPQSISETRLEAIEKPNTPKPLSLLSFSSMVHKTETTTALEDEPLIISPNTSKVLSNDSKDPSIHDLPKGTETGLLLHSILEQVDFTNEGSWKTLIEQECDQFNYPTKTWSSLMEQMLKVLSDVKIGVDAPFSLNSIPAKQLFAETEFTLAINIQEPRLTSFLNQIRASDWAMQMNYSLPDFNALSPLLEGYMRGIIDLWFEKEGKYYLIDWKSNWLGESIEDYDAGTIVTSMNEHHYHLQYLIYLLAINRYLKLANPSYDYNRDFGGVYYFYLRGLEHPSTQGIYATKPPLELLNSLGAALGL